MTFCVGGGFTFRTRFRYVVIGFAEWAAGPPAGQPWIETTRMKCMATAESTDIIVVFKRVQAYCARVAGIG